MQSIHSSRNSSTSEWVWQDPFARDNQKMASRARKEASRGAHSPSSRALPPRQPSPSSLCSEVSILRIDLDSAYPVINISAEDLQREYRNSALDSANSDTSTSSGPAPHHNETGSYFPYVERRSSKWQAPTEWNFPSYNSPPKINQTTLSGWSLTSPPIYSPNHPLQHSKKTNVIVKSVRRASSTIATFVQTHGPDLRFPAAASKPNSQTPRTLPSRPKLLRITSPWALTNAFNSIPTPAEFQTILHSLTPRKSLDSLELWIFEELSWRMNRGMTCTTFRDELIVRYLKFNESRRAQLRVRIKGRLLQKGWSSEIVEVGDGTGTRLEVRLLVVE